MPTTVGELVIPTEVRDRLSRTVSAISAEALSRRTATAIKLRAGRRRPPPDPSGPFLSAVVRLPQPVATRVQATVSCIGKTHPGHYLYPTASIHFTVSSLDHVDGHAELRSIVGAIERTPQFPVGVAGLALSPETIFAEVRPLNCMLADLRRRLRRVSDPGGRWFPRLWSDHVAVANVLRFRRVVNPDVAVDVARFRRTHFGRFHVREVEIVETDKVLSPRGTRVVASIKLLERP